MWQKIKLGLLTLVFVLLLVVTLQNTAPTETKLLFYEVTMPQAASMFLAAAIGFTGGALAVGWFLTRRKTGSKR